MNDKPNCSLPVISVIVAVKNGERYLSEALASVIATQYEPLEIIVIDGCSEDRTEAIARSFDHVRFIRQTGKGIAAAYNQGIAEARGKLIAFVSHDDIWVPEKLRLQVAALEKQPNTSFSVGKARFFLEEGAALPAGFRPSLLNAPRVAFIMETLLARRSVFDIVGPFDKALDTAEDVDWFSRARDLGIEAAVVDVVLLHKRVHTHNSSLSSDNTRFLLTALKRSINRKLTAGTKA